MTVAKNFIVTGRVQGVFFRANTQAQARAHNLVGWVCNLPTGEVEGVACGEEQDVEALLAWLAHGPRLARVDDLEVRDCAVEDWQQFEIL